MTYDEMIAALYERIKEHGSQREFCRLHGISTSHLFYVVSKQRLPTDKFLSRIGFKRTITYAEIK